MAEEVEEEMMALEAIFYDSFSKIDDRRFRLRIDPNPGNDDTSDPGGPPPLFLEILLPDGYPQVIPEFDISNLNNMNYSEAAKRAILEGLHSQASNQIGENMCYNLAEWLKENLPGFFILKNVAADHDSENMDALSQPDAKNVASSKKDAKEKLSKSQKRRYFDRFGAGGEKPRGWNWVSIISHVIILCPIALGIIAREMFLIVLLNTWRAVCLIVLGLMFSNNFICCSRKPHFTF